MVNDEKLNFILDEIYFKVKKMEDYKSSLSGDMKTGYGLALHDIKDILELIKNRFDKYINNKASLVSMEDVIFELDLIMNYLKKYKKPIRNPITKKVLEFIFTRDKFTCKICGVKDSTRSILEIDHIIPVSRGGTDKIDNLQTLCIDCNREKRNKLM